MHEHTVRLGRELLEQTTLRNARVVVDERLQERFVVLGEQLVQRRVVYDSLHERVSRAEPTRRRHRDDRGPEAFRDGAKHPLLVGSGAIDLVHEQERRYPEPLQRAHQDPCLRLDALDRGDDEHRTVEDAQHALDLRDEVRVAGSVDQVDVDVTERERGDRRFDRDATLALEGQGVGLGRSGIDASDLVDDPGFVQKPLGESGLTGVYMRHDSKVELSLRHASFPPNGSQGTCGWI